MSTGPAIPPPPGSGGGNKKSKGTGGIPPPPSTGSTSTKRSSGSEGRTLKTMLRKHHMAQYSNWITAAAKVYKMSAVQLAAALIAVSQTKNGVGIANIRDAKVNGRYNSSNLVMPPHRTFADGEPITQMMKNSAEFSIFYLAWRLQGAMTNGQNFAQAVAGPHGYDPAAGNPNHFIPGNYTPSAGNATGGVDTAALASAARGLVATGTNPFVIFNKKTGKITYTTALTGNVLTYDGVPITRSTLMRQVQDKAGIGGDYYNFTGRSPNPHIVASIMATGRNLQQLENQWITDTRFFKNSPAGKKYQAGYQDAWSQIMGKNSPIPWKLVEEAAQSNLNETEFAAKLRMDGFAAQRQNKQWSYLNSNEFQSRVDAYTLSYEKIYGQPLKDTGMTNLAKDAALAGWDSTQWEAYLRSQPEYTHTAEYQGHALGILNQLGMDFGFVAGLGANGYSPKNPDNQLPGPPTDQRVNSGQAPKPNQTGDNMGVVIPTA